MGLRRKESTRKSYGNGRIFMSGPRQYGEEYWKFDRKRSCFSVQATAVVNELLLARALSNAGSPVRL
jgi:hypothetical protein